MSRRGSSWRPVRCASWRCSIAGCMSPARSSASPSSSRTVTRSSAASGSASARRKYVVVDAGIALRCRGAGGVAERLYGTGQGAGGSSDHVNGNDLLGRSLGSQQLRRPGVQLRTLHRRDPLAHAFAHKWVRELQHRTGRRRLHVPQAESAAIVAVVSSMPASADARRSGTSVPSTATARTSASACSSSGPIRRVMSAALESLVRFRPSAIPATASRHRNGLPPVASNTERTSPPRPLASRLRAAPRPLAHSAVAG